MSIHLAERAEQFLPRTAIVALEGAFTYQRLLDASHRVASFLLAGSGDLHERPVAFLAPPGFDYVAVQWGIWRAGGIAVPLSQFYPRPELDYVLQDTHPAAVITHPDFENLVGPLARERSLRFGLTTEALDHVPGPLASVLQGRRAMILYTSGTTYVKLIEAWEKAPRADQVWMSEGCARMRLMVSGSAALPVSVDIIKTGGYKVSALEIEEVLRTHPAIRECAVAGVPDALWGERVSAALVLHEGMALDIGPLREWAKEQLAPYKIPKDVLVVAELPKNAMGKVSKPSIKTLMEGKHA